MNRGNVVPAISKTYPVMVNYDWPFTRMIEAGGYDWVKAEITPEHFPVGGKGCAKVSLLLVHFDTVVRSSQVVRFFRQREFRLATFVEILAFGAQYPQVQRCNPIVELGTVWAFYLHRGAAYLSGGAGWRHLGIVWYGDDWHPTIRFLAALR